MPGLNRRGPMGEGPMTGRKMGWCNPDNKGKTDDETIQNKASSLRLREVLGRGSGLGRGLRKGRSMGMRFRGNA